MKCMWRAAWGLVVALGVARADLVYLTNGRTVEGELLEHTAERVALKLPGGKIVFPTSQVSRVERRRTARQEFGERVRRTDMNDPAALDELALWASSRGLGEEALALGGMAQGLRLEARIDAIRDSKRPGDFVEVFHWARGEGCSDEVLEWLLEQATELGADDPEVGEARRLRADDLALRAAEAARREEIRRRPRYKIPRDDDDPLAGPPLAPVRKGEGQDPQLVALQAELERQREQIKALEDEAGTRTRRVIRRRRPGHSPPPPPCDVELLPVPPVVMPPGALPPNPSGRTPPCASGALPPPPPLGPPPPMAGPRPDPRPASMSSR